MCRTDEHGQVGHVLHLYTSDQRSAVTRASEAAPHMELAHLKYAEQSSEHHPEPRKKRALLVSLLSDALALLGGGLRATFASGGLGC